MTRLLQVLPGLPMSVSELTSMVRHMWDSTPDDGHAPLSDFRASQMNLVLHFGTKTTPEEASRIFDTAIAFAQRYPCRIIVLCPRDDNGHDEEEPLEAKLFSQCYVGPNLRELCCCEALMLSYPLNTSELIDHAVSLWLETDLPVYHWFHRVPPERIDKYYRSFLYRSQRVLFDRDVEGARFDALSLPDEARIVDLARARSLPIRQNLGQFLSNFHSETLINGLERVAVGSHPESRGEAESVLGWMREAITRCGQRAGVEPNVEYVVEALDEGSSNTFEIHWRYKGSNYLKWHYNAREQAGQLAGDFGTGHFQHPLHIEALAPAQTLAEALFF